MPVTSWFCDLAWVPDAEQGHAAADVLVETDGQRITSVEEGARRSPGSVHLRGLVLPGFANAHSHAFHRALRARTDTGAGTFWSWRALMYRVAARLDPDGYHRLARATFAEMALAGVTAVGEFHYLHHGPGGRPYEDPNAMGAALVAAAADAGIRITLLDTCYLRGGFDQELNDVQRRFSDGSAEAWAQRAAARQAHPHVRLGAAVHSVRAVDRASLPVVSGWADRWEAPLHVHLSEQPEENEACLAATGRSPTRLLAETGILGSRTTAVHATHLTERDIADLGGSGTVVCLCPTTERNLADGIGPGRLLREAGSRLCIGSDSHAVIDPFEEVRAIELDERLVTRRRGNHSPEALLAAATRDGMGSLGWDAGALRPGAWCDLVALDLSSPRLAGFAIEHAASFAVMAATAADVTDVVATGRHIVADRRHRLIEDVAGELGRSVAMVAT